MNTDEQLQQLSAGVSETAHKASETASETIQSVRAKADAALIRGRSFIREQPLAVILGSLAVGFAAGYVMAHRERRTFRQLYVDEPLHSAQEALQAVLEPLAAKMHEHYAAARDATGHALDKLQHPRGAVHELDSWVRRVGNHLKFW